MKDNNKVKVACFGEILWDIFPGRKKRVGGAPFNVAYHLSKMGVDVRMISSIGDDELGRKLLDKINAWNISSQGIQINRSFPTSTVIANFDENNEANYVISEGVAWDHIQLTADDKNKLECMNALVFGSLATRSHVTRNTLYELLDHSNFNVFDINLRAPHYDKKIIKELLHRTHLAKFNKAELRMMLEFLGKDYVDERDSMVYLQEKFDLKEIVVSKGSKGALYLKNDKYFIYPAAKITVKDTVGSGDSFLAGFLSARLATSDAHEAMINGLCLGAYVTSHEGACPEYSIKEYQIFKKNIVQEHLKNSII